MTLVGMATRPAPVDVSNLEMSLSTSSSLTNLNSKTPGEMIFERFRLEKCSEMDNKMDNKI